MADLHVDGADGHVKRIGVAERDGAIDAGGIVEVEAIFP